MPIISRDVLVEQRREWSSKVVGFTSGTFDLLHPGHVSVLEEAKAACDLLCVGVNSDSSVRTYKSPQRPIQSENDRLKLVASLRAVDYAFLFDELNNNRSVELLQPDVYFKGGDYQAAQLSSGAAVEAYGGRVVLIPFVAGFSTTKLIERIVQLENIAKPQEKIGAKRPVAFLDRDGTLIELIDYLSDPHQVRLLPTVIQGLKELSANGYQLVMVTNQPGIGLGYFSKADFYKVMLRFFELVSSEGVLFDKVYFAPDSQAGASDFRKPGVGMFRRAINELAVDVTRSFVIGDSVVDLQFAQACGLPSVLVSTGKKLPPELPVAVTPNFLAAVRVALDKSLGCL